MVLAVKRGLLASALCLVLILPSISFVPASAAAGEWTGTIEEDFQWFSNHHIKGHAEFTFTVNQDGTISGSGTGWEQGSMYYDNGELCTQGRDDNIAFKISGYFSQGTRKASIRIEEITPERYYPSPCGTQEIWYSPFYQITPFEIDLKDGASASLRSVGTLAVVIHGSGSSAECPQLTITPTLPLASDPRNLAGPTDTASYRFQVAWGGKTPIKVYFNVQGGTGTVSPSFVFNPANMQTSPISVLMDVSTWDAGEGVYPLTVDAWVIDPDTGQECHAIQTANVTLVVSTESRASVLLPVKHFGDVRIMPEATEGGGSVVVETGNDGAVTFTVPSSADSSTTVDVNSDTRFTFDQLAKMVEKASDQESAYELGAREEDEQFAYELWESQEESLVKTILGKVEKLSNSIRDFAYSSALGREAIIKSNDILTCLIAPADPQVADMCSHRSMIFIHKGELHIVDVSEKSKTADRISAEPIILTDNSLIIPTDTEFVIKVQQSNSSVETTVVLLEGSAIVVDLVSDKIDLVNAGQRYEMKTSATGQTFRSMDNWESISSDSFVHWWVLPVEDSATSKGWDGENGRPVNRSTIFNNQDGVNVWIAFQSTPEHDITFKYYRPNGALFWNFTYPSDYAASYYNRLHGGYLDLKNYRPDDNYGRWKVDVYADRYLVNEMFFYVVDYATIDGQSARYTLDIQVDADDAQIESVLENAFASELGSEVARTKDVNMESANDIEWIQTTITGDSPTAAKMRAEMKLRNLPPTSSEETSLYESNNFLVLPIIGIDEDFALPAGGDAFPSQINYVGIVDIDFGNSRVKAYEFSGNKKLVDGEAFSDITILAHFEKHTGMLLDYIILGKTNDMQVGRADFTFSLAASEMSIPTTLTILPLPSKIQQNQQVTVRGNLSPPIDGQVALTYQKDGTNEQPIVRTVAMENGSFSDTYAVEKDDSYLVSAQYLGSGAYLSSTTDKARLTVTPSGCLIATAAFGSELTPQVQFLRNFRDNHIMSTAAGSSFMNVFNAWYYSFSPYVADYEREQPWLQQIVRTAIYPLLGILTVSERAYASMPGEYGAITAGIVTSAMIGMVYFWPAVFAAQRFYRHSKKMVDVLTIIFVGFAIGAVSISLLMANPAVLTISTSLLVLTVVATSALFSARLVGYMISKFIRRSN